MFSSKMIYGMAVTVLAALAFVAPAISQESRPARGERGNFDPEQMRQRMEQFRQEQEKQMKETMGATDDEWKVLQPKIEKVTTLQRESMRGGMMGMMRMGRGGPRDGEDRPAPAVDPNAPATVKTAMELQKVVAEKDAKPEDIKKALEAYRAARAAAKAELEKAQKELRDIVTVKQEAVLVARGLLE